MVITVTGRHVEITPALKTFAEEKANKLTKYYDLIQQIEVIIDAQKAGTTVEMIVNAEHNNEFIATVSDGDAYANIDGCVQKLERQLTEHKKKHRNRKHPEQ
ncbi:MAG TPA: ribosome-associated translation inhibitor RaiA [Humisphaera sp.]